MFSITSRFLSLPNFTKTFTSICSLNYPSIYFHEHKVRVYSFESFQNYKLSLDSFPQNLLSFSNQSKGSLLLGLVSGLDFENDEIAEVFGADKSGTGLLGYSSHVSKKQALHASLATAVMAAKINPTNNAQRHDNMDETQLIKHTELVTKIVLHAMAKHLQKQPPANANLIPDVEIPDRCSNPCLVGVENPNNGIQVVHLFDRERRDVATGSVVYGKDGQYFHGLQVYSDERKIALETIVDPSCPLPHRPQADDRYHLTDYAPGEWVIWPESRMEFIEV